MRSISPSSPGILQLKSSRGTTDPRVSQMHMDKVSLLSASAASDGFGGSFADANGPKHAWRRGGFVLTIAYDLWVPSHTFGMRPGPHGGFPTKRMSDVPGAVGRDDTDRTPPRRSGGFGHGASSQVCHLDMYG